MVDKVESFRSEDADPKAIVENFDSCQKKMKGEKPEPAPEVNKMSMSGF